MFTKVKTTIMPCILFMFVYRVIRRHPGSMNPFAALIIPGKPPAVKSRIHAFINQDRPQKIKIYFNFSRARAGERVVKRYRFDYDISLEGWQTGGLPPEDVVAFLKSKGIPIKEEYRELLYLLQVPEVWRMIIGRSRLLVNQYKNQNKRRKL